MANRALVVAPSDRDPAGAGNDADCMAGVLADRGFVVERCVNEQATYQGILAAYDRLIAGVGPGDAAVVFYSGHGGRHDAGYQFICPYDLHDSTDDDFRGILSYELAAKLAALTAQTHNATVILQCCFAGEMSRSAADQPAPKKLHVKAALLAARVAKLGADVLAPAGNPFAVRVVACGPFETVRTVPLTAADRAAFRIAEPRDGRIGGFTCHLAELLRDLGRRQVSWRVVVEELRRRSAQRPDIAGPVARVPFSLAVADAAAVPAALAGDAITIEAGRLHGVSPDDVYAVVPADATDIADQLIARITIDDVDAATSTSRQIAWRGAPAESLPPTTCALPIAVGTPRFPVVVTGPDGDVRERVAAAVGGSLRLRVAGAGAGTGETGATITVAIDDGGNMFVLSDGDGPLYPALPLGDDLGELVLELEKYAVERQLRRLVADHGIAVDAVTLEVGVVDDQGALAPIADGATVNEGARAAVRIVNQTTELLYACAFDVGLRRTMSPLYIGTSGKALPPGVATYFAETTAPLAGFRLEWPRGLDRAAPRRESVVAIVTRVRVDLSTLVNPRVLVRDDDKRGAVARTPFAILWRDFLLAPNKPG